MSDIKEKLEIKKLQQIEKIKEELEKIENPKYSLKEFEKSRELETIYVILDEIKMLVRMNSLL